MHQILRIDGTRSCALIEFERGQIPLWRHYGARLPQTPLLTQWSAPAVKRLPQATMDRMDGIALLPGFGNGFHFSPALRAHQDGRYGIQELVATGFERHDTANHDVLVLILRDATTDPAAQLEVRLTLRMHRDSDVLSMDTQLCNLGLRTLQVDRITSGTLTLGSGLSDVGYFTGQWASEFEWQREPLGQTGWHTENRRGKTSHETPGACFVLSANASDHSGEVIAAHLAWSGNHYLDIDRQDDGTFTLQGGEWLAPGELRLKPEERFVTSPLVLTWSNCGLNGASNNLHRFTRTNVLQWSSPSMPARLVHLNTWEAVYFNHDSAVLFELAEHAAHLGIERFVLDDGWFPGRPDDGSGLGDWWTDPVKYPQGLDPLIHHVQALGLSFGLWVEPEMVSVDSALYRAHPDWALQTHGRPLQFGRQQLVLDISRPDVSTYLFDKLHALLEAHTISYLKWDMNRDLAQAEDANGRMAYRKQVPALYALLGRLHAAHPALEIESCASGGGRMDLGILRHTQRFWTSDNNDALSRVAIQSGAARLFPLEVLGAHVGPAPAHSTGRTQSMAFRAAVACFGHMGVEADVRLLDAPDRATLAVWITFYKQWRHLLHSGNFHQGETANGSWWLVTSADQCLLNVITTRPPKSAHHTPLRLLPFSDDGIWRVRLCGEAGLERARGQSRSEWLDALRTNGVIVSGGELQMAGLPLPNMNPESALVFSFNRE